MSVLFIVIVGSDNVPIYLKSRNMFQKNNDDPSEDIDLLYELHSSLDIVEEKSRSPENRDQYLGKQWCVLLFETVLPARNQSLSKICKLIELSPSICPIRYPKPEWGPQNLRSSDHHQTEDTVDGQREHTDCVKVEFCVLSRLSPATNRFRFALHPEMRRPRPF